MERLIFLLQLLGCTPERCGDLHQVRPRAAVHDERHVRRLRRPDETPAQDHLQGDCQAADEAGRGLCRGPGSGLKVRKYTERLHSLFIG